MKKPRYPKIRLELDSRNPLAWVSAVRQALRRSGVPRDEIRQFSDDALDAATDETETREVCASWADIDPR